MARWHVQRPGAAPVGPFDAADLQAAWNRNEVPPHTMVCADGFSQWVPFHTVAELVGLAPAVSAAVARGVPPMGALAPASGLVSSGRAGPRGSARPLVLGISIAGAVGVLVVVAGILAFPRLTQTDTWGTLGSGSQADDLGVPVYETRDAFEKQMKLSADAPNSNEFTESIFKLKREPNNTRVLVRHADVFSYKGYSVKFNEVEIVGGPDNGRRLFTKEDEVSPGWPCGSYSRSEYPNSVGCK